ncbi:type II secretion system protein [Orenia marismortui]|uniref:type II secretion system protein n=1 Tax=Orenia marismortui TaxID=46469 RepID=UPI00037FE745|nr:type II secretion system protein [Orenia marismortui]
MINPNNENAYTMIEIIVVLAIFSIIISQLALINQLLLDSWNFNKRKSSLEDELRISMSTINNNIQSSLYIKEIDPSKVIYLNKEGEYKEIYYKKGLGLCMDSDQNIISNKVRNLDFKFLNNILYIQIGAGEKEEEFKLKTAIKVNYN